MFRIRFNSGTGFHVRLRVRADRTRMLEEASQWSPRLALRYHIRGSGYDIRGRSIVLTAPQARSLLGIVGRRRESCAVRRRGSRRRGRFGVGATVGNRARLQSNADPWRALDVRTGDAASKNVADPNVLFGTTMCSECGRSGTWRRRDVRLDLPRLRGVSRISIHESQRRAIRTRDGWLVVEDEVIEIADGTRSRPHDQRNVGSFGVSYDHVPSGSGVLRRSLRKRPPLEVDEDELDEVMERPVRPRRLRRGDETRSSSTSWPARAVPQRGTEFSVRAAI